MGYLMAVFFGALWRWLHEVPWRSTTAESIMNPAEVTLRHASTLVLFALSRFAPHVTVSLYRVVRVWDDT